MYREHIISFSCYGDCHSISDKYESSAHKNKSAMHDENTHYTLVVSTHIQSCLVMILRSETCNSRVCP